MVASDTGAEKPGGADMMHSNSTLLPAQRALLRKPAMPQHSNLLHNSGRPDQVHPSLITAAAVATVAKQHGCMGE